LFTILSVSRLNTGSLPQYRFAAESSRQERYCRCTIFSVSRLPEICLYISPFLGIHCFLMMGLPGSVTDSVILILPSITFLMTQNPESPLEPAPALMTCRHLLRPVVSQLFLLLANLSCNLYNTIQILL